VKLNEFLNNSPERKQFAVDVMTEMRDGIEVLLLKDPEYEAFRKDIVPGEYLDGAAKLFLNRFFTTDDTLGRILARLRKPTPNDYLALQQFVQQGESLAVSYGPAQLRFKARRLTFGTAREG
jgi:hypothetical protein